MRDLASEMHGGVCSICGDLIADKGHPECSAEKQRLYLQDNKKHHKNSLKISSKQYDEFAVYIKANL